jgi:hypothetical protein
MEEIDYGMLYRWLVGMNLDGAVWDVTVFTKNRNRLLEGDVAREFLSEVVKQAQSKDLTSDEHFTVDGTLIGAWVRQSSTKRQSPMPLACRLRSTRPQLHKTRLHNSAQSRPAASWLARSMTAR